MSGPIQQASVRLNATAQQMREISGRAKALQDAAEKVAAEVAAVFAGVGGAGGSHIQKVRDVQSRLRDGSALAGLSAVDLEATATAILGRGGSG